MRKDQTPEVTCRNSCGLVNSTRESGNHWSMMPGSLPVLRSLLARQMVGTGDSEMFDWYMAVMEDVEHEAAESRHSLVPLGNRDTQDFLNAIATEIYIAGIRQSNIRREN